MVWVRSNRKKKVFAHPYFVQLFKIQDFFITICNKYNGRLTPQCTLKVTSKVV